MDSLSDDRHGGHIHREGSGGHWHRANTAQARARPGNDEAGAELNERAARVANHVILRLLPEAIERAEQEAKAAEQERERQREEEERARQEAEAQAREEQAAAEKAEAEAAAARAASAGVEELWILVGRQASGDGRGDGTYR